MEYINEIPGLMLNILELYIVLRAAGYPAPKTVYRIGVTLNISVALEIKVSRKK